MTIRNKTCVFETNHVYDSLSDKIMDGLSKDLTHENREQAVVSSQRLETTDKQVYILSNESTQTITLLVKSAPATRRLDLAGRRMDIKELGFVSKNKMLVKIETFIPKRSAPRKAEKYADLRFAF